MTRRYHPVLVVLHWLLALMILGGLLVGGLVLAETPNDDPAKLTSLLLHMVSGLTILALMIGRLGLRLFTAKPPHADIGNGLLNTGASAAHWALYLLVIGMSVSGIVMSNTAGLPDIVFGGSGAPLPENFDDLAARTVHGIISTLLWLLIAGHVLAALYHHFVRKDGLLRRMWFGDRNA
jgi:cytochrome b561